MLKTRDFASFYLFLRFLPFFLRRVTNVGSTKGGRGNLGGGLPRASWSATGEIPATSFIRLPCGAMSNRLSITRFPIAAKLSPSTFTLPGSFDNSLMLHLYSGPSGWFLKTKQLGARAYGVTTLLNNVTIIEQLNNSETRLRKNILNLYLTNFYSFSHKCTDYKSLRICKKKKETSMHVVQKYK